MAQRTPDFDPTIYPVEEKVGEDTLQREVMEQLRPLVARYLASRGVVARVGADQFVYYRQFDSSKRLSPDIYVLPGVAPGERIASWKTWEHGGLAPSFVIEVVSKDWEKDYCDNPPVYDEIGTRELVIFDPDFERHEEGVLLQVFRRLSGQRLRRVEWTNDDRVWSSELGCYLRVVAERGQRRLRLGVGPRGERLFPTAEEAERAEKETALRQARVEKEAALASVQAEREAKELALAERDALLAEIARLKAERGG